MSRFSIPVHRQTHRTLIREYKSGHRLHLSVVTQHVRRKSLKGLKLRLAKSRDWILHSYQLSSSTAPIPPLHPILMIFHRTMLRSGRLTLVPYGFWITFTESFFPLTFALSRA